MAIGDILDLMSPYAQCEIAYYRNDDTIVPYCYRFDGFTTQHTKEFKLLDKTIPVKKITTRNHVIMLIVTQEELIGSLDCNKPLLLINKEYTNKCTGTGERV